VLTPAIATDQTDLVAPAGPVAARATAPAISATHH